MAPECLDYLRGDKGLQTMCITFSKAELQGLANKYQRRMLVEENQKCNIAGSLGKNCSGQLNGLSVKLQFPLFRVIVWRFAFFYRNRDFFNALHALGHKLISAMSNEKRGLNGQHFLDTELLHWLLVNAEVHFTIAEKKGGLLRSTSKGLPKKRAKVDSVFWEEPEHNDGAASMLHVGITLYGERDVIFQQGEGRHDVVFSNKPGSVYFGGVTGAKHNVVHKKCEEKRSF